MNLFEAVSVEEPLVMPKTSDVVTMNFLRTEFLFPENSSLIAMLIRVSFVTSIRPLWRGTIKNKATHKQSCFQDVCWVFECMFSAGRVLRPIAGSVVANVVPFYL